MGLDTPPTTPPSSAPAAKQLRRWFWVAASLVVVVAALGWLGYMSWWPKPAVHYTGPVDHIRTGLIGEYASLIVVAQDQGYFKANGLDVSVTDYDSGPSALADLFAGKLDTAMAADFAGVRNSFSGEDLKVLATMSKSETFFIVVRKGHGIASPVDLKGKKIGLTRKTVGEFYLGQYLTFNQLALRDVTIVDQPPATLIDQLAAGKIDAAVLFEPNAYNAQKRVDGGVTAWNVQSGQSLYSLLYSTGAYTKNHPDVIKRYLQAVVQAQGFMQAHDKEARAIVARRFGYTPAYIDYIWPKYTFAASLDQELLLNMDDEARWAIENHLTTATKVPNYLKLLYLDGLQSVAPESVTIIK